MDNKSFEEINSQINNSTVLLPSVLSSKLISRTSSKVNSGRKLDAELVQNQQEGLKQWMQHDMTNFVEQKFQKYQQEEEDP